MPDDPIQSVPPPEPDLSGLDLTGQSAIQAGADQGMQQAPSLAALSPGFESASTGDLQTAPPQNLPQIQNNQPPPRPLGTGAASQPVDRKQYFREMLGNFLYSVGQGLSQQGTGPGANARGLGAAITAIPQRDIMMRQLAIQQQQAKGMAAYHQAQAAALQQQNEPTPVTINGQTLTLPANVAKQILAAQAAAKGKVDVQNVRNEGALDQINAKKEAGDVTITDSIAKTLGLSPDTVGKNYNAAQIKALTPRITQPNVLGLIAQANKGDKDAQAILDTKQKMDESLMKARGMAFGQGRLWSLQAVYDPETGETRFDTGFGILQAQQQGKTIMPVGKLPQDKIVAVQQLQSEATPALKNFESASSAFDNPKDRAIFARVMKGSGDPVRGDESTWLGNVFNAAAKEDLSPQGKLIATQYGPRLAETMGRLRSTLGLQATDQAMALTLRLIPGGSTPDASTARGQLGQIREMIDQAINIPAFGSKGGGPKKSGPLTLQEAQGYLQQAGGDKDKARALAKKDGRTF